GNLRLSLAAAPDLGEDDGLVVGMGEAVGQGSEVDVVCKTNECLRPNRRESGEQLIRRRSRQDLVEREHRLDVGIVSVAAPQRVARGGEVEKFLNWILRFPSREEPYELRKI